MQKEVDSNGVGVQEGCPEVAHQIMEPRNEEITLPGPRGRRVDLSLQITPRPVGFGSSCNAKGLLQSQSSLKGSSSPGGFLRGVSFKNKSAVPDGERRSLLNPDAGAVPESPVLANSISELSWKRCTSLPVTPASNLSPSVSTPATARTWTEQQKSRKGEFTVKVPRSLSVPMRNVVIVRSTSFATRKEHVQADLDDGQITPVHMEENDEEIPEEEAVCRICLIELCEGGNTFKLECSCKGALRLTHKECVTKWFSIKGNKKCDVCGQEVSNLPVTLLKVQSSTQRANRQENNRWSSDSQSMSVWKDLVVLVLISTICYFFFLEQLLVHDMKSQAIVIAAPFSLTLGLLASIFAIMLAIKEYIWTYAALEFVLVAVTLHLFYSMLHLRPLYAIMLSSFLGFGTAMSINSLYLHIFAWRVQVAQTQANSNLV